jgi:predicted DNA-binding transcriptional regulator YafY
LSYLKHDSSQYKSYEVSPLGVVMRGPVTYLVACKVYGDSDENGDDSQERMFALHRIRKAEMLGDKKSRPPKGVTFEGFIERGGSDFVIGKLANGQLIKLEVDVSREVAIKLSETPLTDNQTLTEIGGDQFRLTASLPITMQLGWWLLAFGQRVEVINPPELREWIASEHRNAAKRYR